MIKNRKITRDDSTRTLIIFGNSQFGRFRPKVGSTCQESAMEAWSKAEF